MRKNNLRNGCGKQFFRGGGESLRELLFTGYKKRGRCRVLFWTLCGTIYEKPETMKHTGGDHENRDFTAVESEYSESHDWK